MYSWTCAITQENKAIRALLSSRALIRVRALSVFDLAQNQSDGESELFALSVCFGIYQFSARLALLTGVSLSEMSAPVKDSAFQFHRLGLAGNKKAMARVSLLFHRGELIIRSSFEEDIECLPIGAHAAAFASKSPDDWERLSIAIARCVAMPKVRLSPPTHRYGARSFASSPGASCQRIRIISAQPSRILFSMRISVVWDFRGPPIGPARETGNARLRERSEIDRAHLDRVEIRLVRDQGPSRAV